MLIHRSEIISVKKTIILRITNDSHPLYFQDEQAGITAPNHKRILIDIFFRI